jgi:hypothetical protein
MLRFWRYSPWSQISWPIYCRSNAGGSPPCWRQRCSRRYLYSGHITHTVCRFFRHRLLTKSLRPPPPRLPHQPSRKGRAILSRISRLPRITDRRVNESKIVTVARTQHQPVFAEMNRARGVIQLLLRDDSVEDATMPFRIGRRQFISPLADAGHGR